MRSLEEEISYLRESGLRRDATGLARGTAGLAQGECPPQGDRRPFVVERGPWRASEDGRLLESDDFTHDVRLSILGDFADDRQRKAYADTLAGRLNARGPSHPAAGEPSPIPFPSSS